MKVWICETATLAQAAAMKKIRRVLRQVRQSGRALRKTIVSALVKISVAAMGLPNSILIVRVALATLACDTVAWQVAGGACPFGRRPCSFWGLLLEGMSTGFLCIY